MFTDGVASVAGREACRIADGVVDCYLPAFDLVDRLMGLSTLLLFGLLRLFRRL
jgi:hypothetical protein